METPGHASHHHAYWEADRGWVYCGDVAGIHLPGTDHVVPPTPPPDIDVERWKASLQKIRAVNPTRLLYTHFGWTDQAAHWLGEVERHLKSGPIGCGTAWQKAWTWRALSPPFTATLTSRWPPVSVRTTPAATTWPWMRR